MDGVKEVEELTPENRVYFGNTKKDPLDANAVLNRVLKNIGFNITFDKEGAKSSDGTLLPDYYRVFVDAEDKGKIKELIKEFLQTSEYKLLSSASIGDTEGLTDQFVDKKCIKIYDPKTQTYPVVGIEGWVATNGELINRALKLADLRRAELHDQWAEQSETDPGFGTPEAHKLIAKIMQENAEGIRTPALDPEGMGIVTYNKINQILEQRPDLRPSASPR